MITLISQVAKIFLLAYYRPLFVYIEFYNLHYIVCERFLRKRQITECINLH